MLCNKGTNSFRTFICGSLRKKPATNGFPRLTSNLSGCLYLLFLCGTLYGNTIDQGQQGNTFVIRNGKSTNHVLAQIRDMPTVTGCIIRGSLYAKCESVNYNADSKECEIVAKDTISTSYVLPDSIWHNYKKMVNLPEYVEQETCVNECNTNNGGCSQICTKNGDSFLCSCRSGYILISDNKNCSDLNECATNNGGCGQTCTNNIGSFACTCRSGFTLAADNKACSDVNECATNNGGCSQNCTNIEGSFACTCRSGYTLDDDNTTCSDLNECATNNGGCGHTCTNNNGSFACTCRSGFTLAADNKACSDLNECVTNNGGCGQTCTNNNGSFACTCRSGFTLAADNKACSDVNECATDKGGCSHNCINNEGSFACTCKSGYTLYADNKTCSVHVGGAYRFKSWNFPTNMIHLRGYEVWIDKKEENNLYIQESTFMIVSGLAGKGISFRSLRYPDRYLTQSNGHCYFRQLDDNDQFRKDASYVSVQGLMKAEDSVSFESVSKPGYFMRHQGFRMKVHRKQNSALFKEDATWRIIFVPAQPATTAAPTTTTSTRAAP